MASTSERENREIEAANESGAVPVVFIHGLWLLPSSWASWAERFKEAGYAPLTPDWPGDPASVPDSFPLGLGERVESKKIPRMLLGL